MPRPPSTAAQKRENNRARVAKFKKQNPARWKCIQHDYDRKRAAWSNHLNQGGRLKGVTGYAMVTASELRKPTLLWMDTRGKLHREKELSAEQLIARYEKKQRKGENEKQKTAGQETPQGAGRRKKGIPAGPAPGPGPTHTQVTVTAQPRESREPMTIALDALTQTRNTKPVRQLLKQLIATGERQSP